jgi:hypothetical protein
MRVIKFAPKSQKELRYRKETLFTEAYQLISFDARDKGEFNDGFSNPIEIRVYKSNSVTYVCVWVRVAGISGCGSGKAKNGNGFNSTNAALWEALDEAGIELDSEYSPENAITFMAGYLKSISAIRDYTINKIHG